MPTTVIKTKSQYREAVKRIDTLMDAAPGTPKGDELELLATLVDIYESKVTPIGSPDPIEAIKFRMDQAGLTQQDLVKYFGSRSRVSEVLNGKRPLNMRIARALHTELGIPANVLLKSQSTEPADEDLINIHRFPVREMAKRDWFAGFSGTPAEAVRQVDDLMTKFLSAIPSGADRCALNRQHVRSGSEMNCYALKAWRIRVLMIAKVQKVKEYRSGVIDSDFMSRLIDLSVLESGPKLAREFLALQGIALVILQHLPRTHLDGAAMMSSWGSPVIALTLRHDRLDNFWFTLCHELAHVALHLKVDQEDVFIDDMTAVGEGLERKADEYAAKALIDPNAWKQFEGQGQFDTDAVRDFAQNQNVHPAIIAGRVRREQNNYRMLSSLVGARMVRRHFINRLGAANSKAA